MKESLKIKHDNLGLFLVRVGLGMIFIAHGYDKVDNIAGVIGFFGKLGLGSFWAYLVAYTELFAGIAVLLGVFARFASLLLAIIMVVAIFLVKTKASFVGGSELDVMLLMSATAIALAGPGEYTACSVVMKKK